MNNNELKHFGIIGMKWGIRRYQNYDGSYTKAGMKRYNAAKEKYEEKKDSYKEAKAAKKQGLANTYDVKKAKAELKGAKLELKKHYKHLKLDKLGDEGKLEYASGKRIRSNASTRRLIDVGGLIATSMLLDSGNTKAAAITLFGSAAADTALRIAEEHSNRRLRAFYGHTSNY